MNREDSEYKKMWKNYLREEKEPTEAKEPTKLNLMCRWDTLDQEKYFVPKTERGFRTKNVLVAQAKACY